MEHLVGTESGSERKVEGGRKKGKGNDRKAKGACSCKARYSEEILALYANKRYPMFNVIPFLLYPWEKVCP